MRLVRMRTQAKQCSESIRRPGPNTAAAAAAVNGSQIIDNVRQPALPAAGGGPLSLVSDNPHPHQRLHYAHTIDGGLPPHQ
jgi:hypothetical protein